MDVKSLERAVDLENRRAAIVSAIAVVESPVGGYFPIIQGGHGGRAIELHLREENRSVVFSHTADVVERVANLLAAIAREELAAVHDEMRSIGLEFPA